MSEIKPFTGFDDRVPLSQVIPLDTPFSLNIYASNACNFRCVYCVHSLEPHVLKEKYDFKQDTMSLSTYANVVSQAIEFPGKLKLISFMGQGEPMINPKLPQMIEMTKSAGIADRVDVVSNGAMLTSQKTDDLLDSGLDVLRISLQGISSEQYKNVAQVKVDFEEYISNLEYFYGRSRGRSKLYVKVMNSSIEHGQEEKFYKIFAKITDRMFIEQIKPVYDGVDYERYEFLLDTDRRGLKHSKRSVCPQPFYTCSIWPNGDVIPCSAIHKVCFLGNVNEGHLVAMWGSRKLNNFRVLHLSKLRNQHKQCKLCCAPDDCSHPEDALDDSATELLKLIQGGR